MKKKLMFSHLRPAIVIFAFCLYTRLLAGSSLSGLVVEDSAGGTLIKVEVRVLDALTGMLLKQVVTDASGRFSVDGLTPGLYNIEMTKPNHLEEVAEISVGSEGTEQAKSDSRIYRLIRYGVISGHVLDAQDQPRAYAYIGCFEKARAMSLWQLACAPKKVNRDGSFRLYGLPPGIYRVGAYGSGGRGLVLFPDSINNPTELSIFSGEQYENLILRSSAESGVTIKGRIQGAEKVISGVTLVPAEQPQITLAVTQTESNGEFHFDNVFSGKYEVHAVQGVAKPTRRFGSQTITVAGSDVSGIEIAMNNGNQVLLQLNKKVKNVSGVKCAGSVVAQLSLVESGTRAEDWVGIINEKEPKLVGPLQPGIYSVYAKSEGGSCYNREPSIVDLRASLAGVQTITVDMAVTSSSISGRLVGIEKPEAYFVILVPFGFDNNKMKVSVKQPKADGSFMFQALPKGSFYIMARPSVGESSWRPQPGLDPDLIEILPGQSDTVTLQTSTKPETIRAKGESVR